MVAYLDHSATTRCFERVQEIVRKTMDDAYGNPSSMHKKGMEAETIVRGAAQTIAKTLKATEKEIIFTSGGTESNNLALIGAAMAHRRAGNRLITTQIEHPSVSNTMKYLQEQGFEVIWLPVSRDGIVSTDALQEAVNDATVLVSVMHVNNEIGSIQPLAEAAKIIHEKNPNTLFHVDAVQSYGKMRIRPKKLGIDLLSASGHKIHGPKGIGFLYRREKIRLQPILFGGGQQAGLRSGTHNVPGIAGLGEAAAEAYENQEDKTVRLRECKERLLERTAQIEGIVINSPIGDDGAPHIVNLSIPGIRSEVMLHALEEHGIYVSAGSACASNHPEPSRTLQAIGLEPALVESALRFSFSSSTNLQEIDYAAEKLAELVPKLRRYVRH
ncbi:Cysteine desulfurase IscS [Eubacterium plexicaudatum ASF492]|uniref:Aminotransferase class V domain-containing protein n=1 Tax=Eubacterium plexicaudatum ASF492 TaxID=1235802 RepID=N2B4E4_9FIRM|nr:Cysteine desulfurase IscS [Eubacterium plexicaudatum ASF492]